MGTSVLEFPVETEPTGSALTDHRIQPFHELETKQNASRKRFTVLSNFAPEDHLRFLHGGALGLVPIGVRGPERSNAWRQKCLPIEQAIKYVAALRGHADVYVSNNRFRGWRNTGNLLGLCALYVDIDFYRTGFANHSPEQVCGLVLDRLGDLNVPAPSLIMFTGRGLQVLWRHSAVPAAALPRWRACQRHLHEVLEDLGADPAALDPTRLFRLARTYNSKSWELARPLWCRDGLHTFDFLADEILPLTREEYESRKRSRTRHRQAGKAPGIRPPQHLWRERSRCLERLIEQRHPQGLPPGQRDIPLFVLACALAWTTPYSQLKEAILAAAGRFCPDWSVQMVLSYMKTVLDKAAAASRGETIRFNGRPCDPRYRFKTKTIIEILQITPSEIESLGLTAFENPGPDRHARTLKQRTGRRAQGALPREQYLEEKAEQARQAFELRSAGLSWKKVGDRIGTSEDAARMRAKTHERRLARPKKSEDAYRGVAMPTGTPRDTDEHAGPELPNFGMDNTGIQAVDGSKDCADEAPRSPGRSVFRAVQCRTPVGSAGRGSSPALKPSCAVVSARPQTALFLHFKLNRHGDLPDPLPENPHGGRSMNAEASSDRRIAQPP